MDDEGAVEIVSVDFNMIFQSVLHKILKEKM